jgi:hypothetical protein
MGGGVKSRRVGRVYGEDITALIVEIKMHGHTTLEFANCKLSSADVQFGGNRSPLKIRIADCSEMFISFNHCTLLLSAIDLLRAPLHSKGKVTSREIITDVG